MNNPKNCSAASLHGTGTGNTMPLNFILIIVSFFTVVFTGCGPSYEQMDAKEKRTEAELILGDQSKLATDTINGITHHFVRTADIKCKVNSVIDASRHIEDLVAKQGGYISSSDLNSTIDYKYQVQVKEDSLLEVSRYTVANLITMRVPSYKLDTVIRKISDLALFIDHRKLRADDVKLKLVAGKLEQARLAEFSDRVKHKAKTPKKIADTGNLSENDLLNKQAAADHASIEQYALTDQVNYSTLSLELYQEQLTSTKTILKPVEPQPYQTPFINKLGNAFVNGFGLLKSCLLFLVNSWGALLLLGLLYIAVRKLFRVSKNAVVSTKS